MIPYKQFAKVIFPNYTGIKINMMPIIMGNKDLLPTNLHQYLGLIDACNFKKGDTVYLSVHESFVEEGEYQRRPGIHTEATAYHGWGGWGSVEEDKGIYMASTDGRCEIWDCITNAVDLQGQVIRGLDADSEIMKPNTMYWLGDKTPHASLPALRSGIRQWFRLVSPDIGIWFSKHNTPNPLGVRPKCYISDANKFV